MAAFDDEVRRHDVGRLTRRVQDLMCIAACGTGGTGLIAVAFAWQPLAGLAAFCIALIVAGVLIGLD